MNWREYKRGGKQVYNRRPAWHLHGLDVEHVPGVEHGAGLDVEHGRVVRHHNGVVLGQGLALFSKSELGFKLKIRFQILSELIDD